MKSVLIVEDDKDLAFLYNLAFKIGKHYQVVGTVSNGLEAVNFLEERIKSGNELPDIVMIDYRMPLMDGLTVIAWIRETYGEKILIILVTADPYAMKAADQAGLRIDGYLKKPFKLSEMWEQMNHITGMAAIKTIPGISPP
ncbi:MAG: response regulator [Candidatus Odinarchaeota archaeon]